MTTSVFKLRRHQLSHLLRTLAYVPSWRWKNLFFPFQKWGIRFKSLLCVLHSLTHLIITILFYSFTNQINWESRKSDQRERCQDRPWTRGKQAGEGGQVTAVKTPILGEESRAVHCGGPNSKLFLSLTSCLIAGVLRCLTARREGWGRLGATDQPGVTGPWSPKNIRFAERRLSPWSAQPAAHWPKEGSAHRGLEGAPRPLQPGNGPGRTALEWSWVGGTWPRPFLIAVVLPGWGPGTRGGHIGETDGVVPEGELAAQAPLFPWPVPCPALNLLSPSLLCCRRTSWVLPRARAVAPPDCRLPSSVPRPPPLFFKSLCNCLSCKYSFHPVASAWFLGLRGRGRGIIALGMGQKLRRQTSLGAIFGKTRSGAGL